MYVRISWWYHLSERTFHYGFIVHLCVLSSPSTLLYIFLFFWIALLHRRRTENIIGSGALGGLRGGGYGACIAPDIFMDLQHPNYSSNFDNLLPNTHFWHLFARFNSQRFDSIRFNSTLFGFGLHKVRRFTVRKQKCFLSPRLHTDQPCCLDRNSRW